MLLHDNVILVVAYLPWGMAMSLAMTEKLNRLLETQRIAGRDDTLVQIVSDQLGALLRYEQTPADRDGFADALAKPWAEPVNEAHVETQIARSRLVSDGCSFEVVVIVGGWSNPLVVDWNSLPQQIPVSHGPERFSAAVAIGD